MGSRPGHSTRAHAAPAVKRPWNSSRRLWIWVSKRHLPSLIAPLKGVCRLKCPPILGVIVIFRCSRQWVRRVSYGY